MPVSRTSRAARHRHPDRRAAAANTLSGGTGNDVLRGVGGGDVLIGGAGADSIAAGGLNDNLRNFVRFTAASEFGDTVTNFDANGTTTDDLVQFSGALNTAWDDGNSQRLPSLPSETAWRRGERGASDRATATSRRCS